MKKQLLIPAFIIVILISVFVVTLDQPYSHNRESTSTTAQYCSIDIQHVLDDNKKARFIEKKILKIYDHLWKSTVRVASGGTGVLVSEDGYIVTAGHVINGANGKEIEVTLYDGTTYDAVCLGVDDAGDYGLLKIKEKGSWDYAEMGSSGSLAKDETCLMLGHSGGFRSDRPAVIRVGFYLETTNRGYLRTSCIMMPGDSGGPLFDLDGKVVGVCSYINKTLTGNYYPPIDKVKENWDKLINGEVFNKRTRGNNNRVDNNREDSNRENDNRRDNNREDNNYEREVADETPLSKPDFVFEGGKTGLIEVLDKEVKAEKVNGVVVKLNSTIDNEATEVMGTLISADGYIVSKSSQVSDTKLICKLSDGEELMAKVIERDEANDLVLIKVNKKNLKYVKLKQTLDILPGQLLGTIGYEGNVIHAGIVGVQPRMVPGERRIHKYGFLGVTFRSGTTAIESVSDEGAAIASGVMANDSITMFNGEAVSTRKDVIDFLKLTKPGENVTLMLLRNNEKKEIEMTLGEAPSRSSSTSRHAAYATIVSERKSDFTNAFTHDMPLALEECGSPVVSLDGQILGVNIARESRSCSFAIPLETVAASVEKMRNKAGV